ncbi:MAG: aldo/keto reductase [Neisseriaceae bacterium]|nr:aldo/keto reductase [Neisseriaceae bacterium]
MAQRRIGDTLVSSIGLGCMNVSHAYGQPVTEAVAQRLLGTALDLGVTHFDTATLYGFGANERLLGAYLKPHRAKLFLASKCGMAGVDGKRVIDGRPETLRAQCEASLERLQTEVLDLYYLHRKDPKVPLADSVGALADLVVAGKVRHIGLSEVSAASLAEAQAIHPIAAVQNEYSLWSRNPELGLSQACRDSGTALVAFSPLGRGFLGGVLALGDLPASDIRLNMPRFQAPHWARNQPLYQDFARLAADIGCTPARLALGWLLAQGEHVVPIPGTTSLTHLHDNMGAAVLSLTAADLAAASQLINHSTVSGDRYAEATLAEIDTESF